MDRRRRCLRLRALALTVLAGAIALGLPQPAAAQQPAVAEVTRVIGRVELLRKGQSQWVPAVIGANLVEGDDIRAFSGASAELTLPDTSTIVVAENSRLLLSKLEFDKQNQSRTVMVHLAVGKMRAIIAQAAITLVRARQSNFVITTPTAVAAARGTIVWVATDGTQTYTAVESQAGTGVRSRIDCLPLRAVQSGQRATAVAVLGGMQAIDCGTPTTLQTPFLNFTNKATENSPELGAAAIVVPSPTLVLQALTGPGDPSFITTPLAAPVNLSPSTLGSDVTNNLLNQAPPPTNVTEPSLR